jgi:phosphate transport system substrate-binding protein
VGIEVSRIAKTQIIKGAEMKTSTKLLAALAATAVVATPLIAQMRRNVRIVGSSTVYPFSKAVAERFARANPGVPTPIVESTGTGAGLKLFCGGVGAGFPDIANASRRMKASEFRTCSANGVSQVTEITIGLDGLSVATAKSTALSNLTLQELYYALAKTPFGKTNPTKTWKDVNSKYPALPIRIYGPPTTSGTRSSVEDLLMEPGCLTSPAVVALKSRDEARYSQICKGIRDDGAYITAGENDNLIVQKLAGNPGSVGLFGYSYLEENLGRLKGISINGVAPSYQTISSFRYPGARAMFFYVKNAHLNAIPGLKAYAAEFVRDGSMGPNGYLKSLGLIALSDAQRQRSQRFATSMTPMTSAGLK